MWTTPSVDLDLRALVALEHVLDDERVEPEGGADRLHLLARRAGQVDPDARVGRRSSAGRRVERLGAARLADCVADDRGDADHALPSVETASRRLQLTGSPARPVDGAHARPLGGRGRSDGARFGGSAAIGVGASAGAGRVGGGPLARQHTRTAAEDERRRDGQGGHRRRPR